MRTLNAEFKAAGSQRGVTLVETLVAVLLIGFVAFAQGRLNVNVIETNRHGANITAASNLALDMTEFLQQQPYALVSSGSDGPLNSDGTTGGAYSRSWVVTNDTPVLGTKTAVVTVAWTDTISSRSVALSTVVSE
ncbi:MAG: prepilin-type N-terminal cleavage/methylation domain-containing protein [Gammaproteobacteria bacterium]|nr:prepilin-type N-terminal cleavage/methylation domain-containing protein [Gammaproteobacteria bacterium]